MKNLADIPARGGSKRIPRKNIRDFLGRPIIAWSIETAMNSGLFDTVMVSTEDPEIAAVATAHGAEVPFLRTPGIADDHAGLIDVLAEVVATFEVRGQTFDAVCCLLATAPLATAERLRQGRDLLATGLYDSVFPVVAYGSPIQRALRRCEDGATSMIDPESYSRRSQDMEAAYHDPGQFYWLTPGACRERQPILSGRAGSFIIGEMEAQDIDTEDDWRLCELKHQMSSSRL